MTTLKKYLKNIYHNLKVYSLLCKKNHFLNKKILQQLNFSLQELTIINKYQLNLIQNLNKINTIEEKTLINLELQFLTNKKQKISENFLNYSTTPISFLDNYNLKLEIQNGTGGLESAFFSNDLFKLFENFFLKEKLSITILEKKIIQKNALRKIVIKIEGKKNLYKHFKWFSGIYRVKRIPITESKGRKHTSISFVGFTPFFSKKINNIQIKKNDLKIETCRSSGHGGQHINTTDSAVVMTYLPLKIVVRYSGERSQLKNRERALELLKLKILERRNQETKKMLKIVKNKIIGENERNEKNFTMDFTNNLFIDHRLNQKFNLKSFFDNFLYKKQILQEITTKMEKEFLQELLLKEKI